MDKRTASTIRPHPRTKFFDLFMFHGFTFYAAAPNNGPAKRGGLYINVCAGL
jgi:hypothetical protein